MTRRFLPKGSAFLAAAILLPCAVAPRAGDVAQAIHYAADPRLERLRQFFAKAACPAAEYAQNFLEVADANSLDWRLLPAIAYVESTGGKAAVRNNFFGWDSGRARFDSPAAGIRAVGAYLAHSTKYAGKSLAEKLSAYNVSPTYPATVLSVMQRIAAPSWPTTDGPAVRQGPLTRGNESAYIF
jgi:hypothetical protein